MRQVDPALRAPQSLNAKLTEADVLELRRLRRNGMSLRALAARFKVDYSTAKRVVDGVTWGWLHDSDEAEVPA